MAAQSIVSMNSRYLTIPLLMDLKFLLDDLLVGKQMRNKNMFVCDGHHRHSYSLSLKSYNPNKRVHHEICAVQRLICHQSKDNKHFSMRLRGRTRHHHFFSSVLAYVECVLGLQEGIIGSKEGSYALFKNPFWGNLRIKQLIYSFVCDRFGTDIWISNTLIHGTILPLVLEKIFFCDVCIST